MKITIEPAPEILTVPAGTQVRRWQGRTESGGPVDVFVCAVGTADHDAQAEINAILAEIDRPDMRPVAPSPIVRELTEIHDLRTIRDAFLRHVSEHGGDRDRHAAQVLALLAHAFGLSAGGVIEIISTLSIMDQRCGDHECPHPRKTEWSGR